MKRHFSLIVDPKIEFQDWCIDGQLAYRFGVPDPTSHPNSHLKLSQSDDLQDQFNAAFPMWNGALLVEKKLAPGQYYARMARPNTHSPKDPPGFPTHSLYKAELVEAVEQIESLCERLRSVSKVVHPDPANLSSYGNEIRELIILAATELETQWRAILQQNGLNKPKMTTKDYVKTLSAMKLDEYEVEYKAFPNLNPFSPFKGWDQASPTTSLGFYDAYNAIKHDRSANFQMASLQNALLSVGACLVIAAAQFGKIQVFKNDRYLSQIINLKTTPSWAVEEFYTTTVPEWGCKPEELKYPF